jgi:DNA-binding GntR family transcriptional regulator
LDIDDTTRPTRNKEVEIVKAMEEAIIFGRLEPGTRLVEDVLMARFSVTRHFIRQALNQLERLGIVTHERNKGATVRSLTPTEVRQIYDLRELLQREAALRISLPADPTLIEKLEAIHVDYSRCIDQKLLRGVHDLNDAFHTTLFAACDNPYLVVAIKYYMHLSLPVRAKTISNPALMQVSCQHHAIMIDLMRGRDNWPLAQLCVDHIQPSKNDYLLKAREIDSKR